MKGRRAGERKANVFQRLLYLCAVEEAVAHPECGSNTVRRVDGVGVGGAGGDGARGARRHDANLVSAIAHKWMACPIT